jgi:hypothetical protein
MCVGTAYFEHAFPQLFGSIFLLFLREMTAMEIVAISMGMMAITAVMATAGTEATDGFGYTGWIWI